MLPCQDLIFTLISSGTPAQYIIIIVLVLLAPETLTLTRVAAEPLKERRTTMQNVLKDKQISHYFTGCAPQLRSFLVESAPKR